MTSTTAKTFGLAALLTATVAAALAVMAPSSAAAAAPRLLGTVGPGHTISLRTASGAPVRSIKAGLYTIVVRDKADDHDFRLVGAGLNKATGVEWMGTQTWRVRFAKGKTYRFVCDPHADEMRGSFRAR